MSFMFAPARVRTAKVRQRQALAFPAVRDLLLCAKHLFIAAMAVPAKKMLGDGSHGNARARQRAPNLWRVLRTASHSWQQSTNVWRKSTSPPGGASY
jgi:hypothetical protein